MSTGNAILVPPPDQYKLPDLVSHPSKPNYALQDLTKTKIRRPIIVEESAKQKEMAIAKWAKTNMPSPCSYDTSTKL